MKTRKDSLERLQKDNITNITKQSQIENYFDFSNPNWKKRHSLLLTFEIINFLVLIITLILFPLINIWKYTLISVFTGTFLISIILFRYKKSSYRYLSYILDVLGMLFVLFIPNYGNIPDNIMEIVFYGWIILGIGDLIFLLKYLTIEYSRERFMGPMIRKNKIRNFYKFGQDNWENM